MAAFVSPTNSSLFSLQSNPRSSIRTSNMGFLKKLSIRNSNTAAKQSMGSWGEYKHTSPNQNVPMPLPTPRNTRRAPRRNPNDTEEAPPAYTPAPQPAHSVVSAAATLATADSPYAFLREFDTIFIIDDSGSMAGRSWRETSAALAAITPICTEQDADGIDIYFLNHRNPATPDRLGGYSNVTSTAVVEEIFRSVRPLGGTPTGTRLNQILKPYLAEVTEAAQRQTHAQENPVKPLNVIVITDGVASDDVEAVIVSAGKKLDSLGAEPWQVGIQFFQVGQEPEAAEELQELDDALAGAHGIRDMVDTVPWNGQDGSILTGEGIMKVTMGAINRKLDRRRGSDERLRR